MLNSSYKDAYLMSEALAFYSSTSTFQNPNSDDDDDDDDDAGHESRFQICSKLRPAQTPGRKVAGQDRDGPDQAALSARTIDVETGASEPNQPVEPMTAARLKKSRSNDMSYSSNKSDYGQRWQDFCDDIAFSIKGRMFIMESNFKRRLRAMRKYLNRKMPWILPSKPTSAWQQGHRNKPSPTGQSLAGLFTFDRAEHKSEVKSRFGCFKFPEPDSAKTLEAQQECLLNRLERIKRDSQRLATSVQSRQIDGPFELMDGGSSGGYDVDTRGRNKGSLSFDAGLRTTNERLVHTSDQGLDFGPTGSILAGCSLNMQQLGDSAMSEGHSSKRFGSNATKPVDGTKQERGRWISRSGRHIRDTALALASPKKLCIVCYERAPNIVTLPCRHGDICSDCFIETIFLAVKHSQYPLKCVLCRQKVERIRCSRRLLLRVIQRKRLKR